MPKAKFVSQRRKKRKFYGNRFTNRRNYNLEGGLDEEKAKETLSASYRRLKSVAEENNPVDKPKKTSTANSDSTITGFRFFDMEVLYNVLTLRRENKKIEGNIKIVVEGMKN